MKKREQLNLAAALLALFGLVSLALLFLSSFQPTIKSLQTHELEVDLSALKPGRAKQIDWEGNKVFVLHRTKEQIAWLKTSSPQNLIKGGKDEVFSPKLTNQLRSFQEKYLVIYIPNWKKGKNFLISETPTRAYSCEEFIYDPTKIQVAKNIVFPGGFYCKSMFLNPISSSSFYESPYVYDPAGRSHSELVMPLPIPYHAFEGDKLILGKR